MPCCYKYQESVVEVSIDDTLGYILKRVLDHKKEFGVVPIIKVYNKQTPQTPLPIQLTPEQLGTYLAEFGNKPIRCVLNQQK
jgi:hypothetical protein